MIGWAMSHLAHPAMPALVSTVAVYIIKSDFIHCILIVDYNNTGILNAIKPSSLTLQCASNIKTF